MTHQHRLITNANSAGTYDARELAPPARPGSLDATHLPRRVGSYLVWPDGRHTDLHGQPLAGTVGEEFVK